MSDQIQQYTLPDEVRERLRNLEPMVGRYGLNKKRGERLKEGESYRDGFVGPKVLTDRYMQMARMAVHGMKKIEIARRLGVSAISVQQVLSGPIVQEYMKVLRQELDTETVRFQDRIMDMSNKALNTLEEVVENGQSDNVRIQAANSILDRNPSTSKHTKQTLERIGATDQDIARWKQETDIAGKELMVEARYEDIPNEEQDEDVTD